MKKIMIVASLFLIQSFSFAQNNSVDADRILTNAYAKATKENKNVFVIFHASWCGWCKKMDKSMQDPKTKKYFDENYETVHLTVLETNKKLETPGADKVLAKYKAEAAGLPFFLILNPKAELLGDSFIDNSNIGCPANEKEVSAFITLLKNTSKIDEDGLKIISKRFRENEAK